MVTEDALGGWLADAANRAGRAVRRHGLVGAARRGAARAGRATFMRETHVWHELDLAARRRLELPAGLRLHQAGVEDVGALQSLPGVGPHESLQRLAAGADLWLVLDGERAVSACWVFRERTPVLAAPDGWLELPPGTVCMEDVVTAPDRRGEGIGPAAWSQVAGLLEAEGVSTALMKIEQLNARSRRAAAKVGFEEVAFVRLTRMGGHAHVEVRRVGPAAGYLGPLVTGRLAAPR